MTAEVAASQAQRVWQALRDSGALLEGHFLLSSGRHAARYFQCALLLQYPERAAALCRDLAELLRGAHGAPRPFDVVIGPALGAVTFAYELARALGARALFAERGAGGGFELRRGFEIGAGERVLVAEDVVTTGRSVMEVIDLVRPRSSGALAVASLVNRSGTAKPFPGLPYHFLVQVDVPSWEAAACPLCADPAAGPARKPGSRPGIEGGGKQ